MEFQAYNATSTTPVPSNTTWPDPFVDVATVAPLVPVMSSLTGLSTDGLINSTLYDTFSKTPQMVNAAVNANTMRANCGLLPNLTYAYYGGGAISINGSMSGVGEVYFASASLQCGWLVVKDVTA